MSLLRPHFWGGLLLVSLLSFGGGYVKGRADMDRSAKLTEQANTIKALEEQRNVYRARTQILSKNAEDAARKRDQARSDAASAVSAANSLRKRLSSFTAKSNDPAAAPRGTSACAAADLLSQLLIRANGAAAELAEYADRARLSGEQCERDYKALMRTSPASVGVPD